MKGGLKDVENGGLFLIYTDTLYMKCIEMGVVNPF